MDKIWFIEVDLKVEGPYSVEDLKRDLRITPDTLAWQEGSDQRLPIRAIKELKKVFEDDVVVGQPEKPTFAQKVVLSDKDELVIDLPQQRGPSSFVFLLFFTIVLMTYLLLRYFQVL